MIKDLWKYGSKIWMICIVLNVSTMIPRLILGDYAEAWSQAILISVMIVVLIGEVLIGLKDDYIKELEKVIGRVDLLVSNKFTNKAAIKSVEILLEEHKERYE